MKDQRIVYGAMCTWWDSIDKVGEGFAGLPCCPHCKGLLLEVPNMEAWEKGIPEYEANGHPGYSDLIKWARGKCFKNMKKAQEAYDRENSK